MYTKWYRDIDADARTQCYEKDTFRIPGLQATIVVHGTHYRSLQNGWECPEHEHILYEINFVTEGKQVFRVSDKTYEQLPGDLILVPVGSIHSSQAAKDKTLRYFCIHFHIDDKAFLPYLNSAKDILFPAYSTLTRRVSPLLYQLIELIRRESVTIIDQIHFQTKIFEFISTLIIALRDQVDLSSKISERKREHAMFIAEKIDALVQVRMEKESGDAFLRNIQDIARELGISTSYCNKVFKRIYKMSPRQYLSFKKLHEAKSLLLQSNLKLEQISNLLGYHDVAHFSRQFKKWSGMTPRQYAKQNTINVNI